MPKRQILNKQVDAAQTTVTRAQAHTVPGRPGAPAMGSGATECSLCVKRAFSVDAMLSFGRDALLHVDGLYTRYKDLGSVSGSGPPF